MRFLPIVLLASVLAAGCGGGGGGSSNGRLSAEDFRSKADAICKKYERQIAKATAGSGTGASQIADTIDKVIPLIEKGQQELTDLKPPEDLQAKYNDWVSAGNDQVEEAKKLRDAARNNDSKAFQASLAKLQTLEKNQDKVGKEDLGLTTCASSG
jgi:hypothetical protein